ncbi:LysR family transcriptional regulator [Tahibacter amnicola]|uniref:LysR family transcriptional regulator n=1 Tax=Tahibacter amnicola TaxID=2976241 RepID=A0ABY6BKJ8_9GAMM|nr:LysR family transcriptional regulator [Tahibacter amnicola]UXI69997.1 LysR family transcriptional regulator [Tahibacter amnicola]
MDKLQAMQLFVRVVDSGSYTAAADQMEISRALASKLIQGLEEQLGVRLLHRTTRKLSLTEAGEHYYQRVAEILGDLGEAEAVAAQLQAEPRGRLRVSAPMSFAIHHLGAAIAEFQSRHPRIELELTLNDRQVDLVEEGFDMAIRIARLTDSSLIARRIAPCRMQLVASPAYLRREGTPRKPTDLSDHNFLCYTLAARKDEVLLHRGEERAQIPIRGKLRVNNGDVIASAAVAGLGICLSPTFLVWQRMRRGELVRVLEDWDAPEIAIHAVYPPGRAVPAKTRSLIDFLVNRFGPEPYWDAAGDADTG